MKFRLFRHIILQCKVFNVTINEKNNEWATTENKVAYGPKKIENPDFESKKENYLNKDKRAQVIND